MEVAHHTHVPANAMRACEWGIPAVVLIRSPYDAIVSRVALRKEVQRAEGEVERPHQVISFHNWMQVWISFYRSLDPNRKQKKLLVAPFQIVIQNLGRVIERVNVQFGTDFVPFEHSDEAVAAVHEELGYHSGPNERRETFKEETRMELDAALQADRSLQEKMDRAERLFDSFVEGAAVS
ncbi:hypothetical protein GGP85_002962 [Salinibacter ruber]|uniref:hypothetical protein n=1 Tax=Salinibacter ruber TaxID=146919 RepID=UPI002169B6A6|nr:hypothetical protein [Salinibacter ruber]MCS3827492.1 hypothetical protein [Salinibacter ruber]